MPTVSAAISTANNPPNKRKLPDLSIAFPKESFASSDLLMSSPGCLILSKINSECSNLIPWFSFLCFGGSSDCEYKSPWILRALRIALSAALFSATATG